MVSQFYEFFDDSDQRKLSHSESKETRKMGIFCWVVRKTLEYLVIIHCQSQYRLIRILFLYRPTNTLIRRIKANIANTISLHTPKYAKPSKLIWGKINCGKFRDK